jgi:cellulose synthase/poly-beta-1,6-N-acetylglucosamine synthase-like glycosyltransferase
VNAPHQPEFSVVIPTYNADVTIRRCLDAVLREADRYGAVEIIVADNGSTDATVSTLRQQYGSRITLIEDPLLTVAGLRNLGATKARGTVLAFIDSDCVIGAEYFVCAREALERRGVSATGSPYALPQQPRWIEATWSALHRRPGRGVTNYLNAGNFVVRRDVFTEIGGFNAQLVTGEDAELGQRLTAAGHLLFDEPAVEAVHLGNPVTLGGFCRQQWWHGLGMFGTARRNLLDKPLVMTLVHLLAVVGIPLWAGLAGASRVGIALAFFTANLLAPATTVAFRIRQAGAAAPILQSLLLYALYYWCRAASLLTILTGFPRPSRGRR